MKKALLASAALASLFGAGGALAQTTDLGLLGSSPTSSLYTFAAASGSFSPDFSFDLGSGLWDVTVTFSNFKRRNNPNQGFDFVNTNFTLDTPTGFELLSSSGGSYTYRLTGVTADSPYTTFSLDGYTGNGGATSVRFNGAFSAAVASPVPEPETYALMLAGLGVVGWAARRRKAAAAAQALPA